jgi:hypothetical protein
MEAKLIKDKRDDDFYYLKIGINTYATTGKESFRVLSLKNCQSMERGYDLDELAISTYPFDSKADVINAISQQAYIKGFQKCLEILGDKKFSENQVKKAITNFYNDERLLTATNLNKAIQSLQQTEWKVSFNPEEKDSEGRLILKRVYHDR